MVARERVTFLGLTLSANRIVNYGPIAPEESRRIFAREALVYGRLRRRPEWLAANDAAIHARRAVGGTAARARSAQAAGILRRFLRRASAAPGIERRDPRALHAASDRGRTAALSLDARTDIRACRPSASCSRNFQRPRASARCRSRSSIASRRASRTTARACECRCWRCRTLTRAAVDAAVPGLVGAARERAAALACPRRRAAASSPSAGRDRRVSWPPGRAARRSGSAQHPGSSRVARCRRRALRVRPHPGSAHLEPRVVGESRGRRARLRHRSRASCAGASRARRAASSTSAPARPIPGAWRRFECDELPQTASARAAAGPAARCSPRSRASRAALEVRFEWSRGRGRAQLSRRRGGVSPASCSSVRRAIWQAPHRRRCAAALERSSLSQPRCAGRDAARARTSGAPVSARARRRARATAFEAAVDRQVVRSCTRHSRRSPRPPAAGSPQARAVRRLLDDHAQPKALRDGGAGDARASRATCSRRAFSDRSPPIGCARSPRYLRAEERRWQRLLARGCEPPQMLAELAHVDVCAIRALRNGRLRSCAGHPISTS